MRKQTRILSTSVIISDVRSSHRVWCPFTSRYVSIEGSSDWIWLPVSLPNMVRVSSAVMTIKSHANIFHITGPLPVEDAGHVDSPHKRASNANVNYFLVLHLKISIAWTSHWPVKLDELSLHGVVATFLWFLIQQHTRHSDPDPSHNGFMSS